MIEFKPNEMYFGEGDNDIFNFTATNRKIINLFLNNPDACFEVEGFLKRDKLANKKCKYLINVPITKARIVESNPENIYIKKITGDNKFFGIIRLNKKIKIKINFTIK